MKKQIAVYIISILILTISVGGLFSLKTKGSQDFFDDYDRNIDKQYISEIKDVLSEYYMGNSGITLTKTSEDGTFTEYTVEIHTGRKNSEEMVERLRALKPAGEHCSARVIISGKE